MSAEAWPRYFHPDGHEITAEEFDAAYDEAQAPRGNSIMTAYDRKYAEELAAAEKRAADMAAIFARLDALEVAQRQDAECMEAQALRIDCMEGDAAVMRERLESARIAAPVAPESAETASGVPQEPGNATEAPRPELADAALEYVHGALVEIANALGVRTASNYEEGQDAPKAIWEG